MRKIDVIIARELLSVSDYGLKNLICFIDEFSTIYKKLFSYNIDHEEFLAVVFGEYESISYNGDNSKIDVRKKMLYKHYLKKYSDLFRELTEKQELFLKLFTLIFRKRDKIYVEFIRYLSNSLDNRALILENLNKIKELEIDTFEYLPRGSLDRNKHMVISHNYEASKNGIDKYLVIGLHTDGDVYNFKKDYEIQDYYNFDIEGANYVISYIKGSAFNDKVGMQLTGLEFDTNTLPNNLELRDASVLPYIYLNRHNIGIKDKKKSRKLKK